MSEPQAVEELANPYNAKKSWHEVEEVASKQGADGLFFERPQQATQEEMAPEEEAPKKRTNYKKRYDDLKKHYDQKISEFKQTEQELLAKASTPNNYAPPKTEEELETFKKDYPDLYDTVETVAHMQSQRQVAELESQLTAMRQRESEVLKREAETTLKENHPDFEDLRSSDEFHEWAKVQPEQIQDWIYKNPDNVLLASKAIDLYKLETGKGQSQTKRQSKRQGSAADLVSTKTSNVEPKEPKIWTEREIAAMSLDQFDKHEEEIKQAMIEGRVVK